MTSLSYTTMNALIQEPHTWLCKVMGLKTFQSEAMTAGKAAHEIIQASVSGVKPHELFKDLPHFSEVETENFDPKMRVQFQINDKYTFNGFLDGKNPETGDMLEIKTGKRWSPGDFAKLNQWKLYSIGLPTYKKIWFVNVPSDPSFWLPDTVRVFNQEITPKHQEEARAFIDKAIYIIEHIKEQELHRETKSRWCYYIDCPYCPKNQNY